MQLLHIDWPHFTPWLALAGGVLIGLAAALFVLLNGRILGVSGIVAGLLAPKQGGFAWRCSWLLGMLAAPTVLALISDATFWRSPQIDASPWMIVLAGLLVGYGTRLGSGCTSGHGVCGLARLSLRSLLATLSFMAAGFMGVGLLRHVF